MNPTNQSIQSDQSGANAGRHKRSLKLVLLFVIVVVVAAAILLVIRHQKAASPSKPALFSATPSTPQAKPSEQYCSLKGSAFICQGITASAGSANQTHKYQAPQNVGYASEILPSPDEGKFLVDTPANAQTSAGSLLYIADKQFKVVRQLPHGDERPNYSGFDWMADSKSLVYAYGESQKSSLYTYDIATGVSRQFGDASNNISGPQVSADGNRIFAVNRSGIASGVLSAVAFDAQNGQKQDIDASAVMNLLKTYNNFTYSRTENLFYIGGTSSKGQNTVFIIAKLVAGGASGLSLQPVKTIDDGYVYLPQIAAGEGMLVTRQKPDVLEYGILHADGSFQLSQIKPTQKAQFGLYGSLTLPELKPSTSAIEDYLYAYTTPAVAVKSLMQQLATDGCPAGSFNAIQLLTQDPQNAGDTQTVAQQAAIQFDGCAGNAPVTTRYYKYQDGNYKQITESPGWLDCDEVEQLQISRVVAPRCVTHE